VSLQNNVFEGTLSKWMLWKRSQFYLNKRCLNDIVMLVL